MNISSSTSHPPQSSDQVPDNVYKAVKDEVKHEVSHIKASKEPVDTSQSDVLVQKHVTKLSISLFVLIALILLAAIVGIALYAHYEKPAKAQTSGLISSVDDPGLRQFTFSRSCLCVGALSGQRNPGPGELYPVVRRSSYR
jgi:hypothetical protein